jgi:hypothetical protein
MKKTLYMAYQSRGGSPRNSGRGRGIPRHEKAKNKEHKRRSAGMRASEEDNEITSEEIASKTLNALRNLGTQKFALPPYSEHLDRWLTDLRQVLSDFESSPCIEVDEQFEKERSQILSNLKLDPQKNRLKEAESMENTDRLKKNRIILEQIEKNYSEEKKKNEERKNAVLERLTNNINEIKREQNHIAQTKTGLFRTTSKKSKAQKEAEAFARLTNAQNELTSATQQFTFEQKIAREEYAKRKQTVMNQIQDIEKENRDQETDDSLEFRHIASEALINAVNTLLQRKGLSNR